MAFQYWLYPGAAMSVHSLAVVTVDFQAPGTVPPAGATIIPPQTPATPVATAPPLSAVVQQGLAANLAIAAQASDAATKLANQQTVEAQATFDAALAKSNQAAEELTAAHTAALAAAPAPQPVPPWSVTFTQQP